MLTTEDLLRAFAADVVAGAQSAGHEGVEAVAGALQDSELQRAIWAVRARRGGLGSASPATPDEAVAFVKSQQEPRPPGHSPLSMRIEAKKGDH